jgi:hypothetical protein
MMVKLVVLLFLSIPTQLAMTASTEGKRWGWGRGMLATRERYYTLSLHKYLYTVYW